MKITLLGDTFEWPTRQAFADGFTIAEEETVEHWTGGLWEPVLFAFFSGGRKAARGLLFVLHQRLHPDAAWSDLGSLSEADWTLDLELDKERKADEPDEPDEPLDPTSAPEGASESAGSDKTTSTDS